MTRRASTSVYWDLVRGCLVEFYHIDEKAAARAVADVRRRLIASGVKVNSPSSLVYHSEPIDVASDVAGEPLPSGDAYHSRYEKLKKQRSLGKSLGKSSMSVHELVGGSAQPESIPLPVARYEHRKKIDVKRVVQAR